MIVERTMGKRTGRKKKSSTVVSIVGLELATTSFRVLTVRPKRHLVVSEAKMDS